MGCDGGTIPKRDELVRTKKKPEQKDKTADLVAKWKHCAITQEPLRQPIMACELGRLYNKEAVLEFLIDRSKFECAPSFEHLKGLKDLKQLNLTDNPSYDKSGAKKGDAYIDMQDSKYICPVVGLEMNGRYKFCFLWNCGCVLSERALKEIKGEVCHKCGKKFTDTDIITLNPQDDEVESLQTRMEARRLQAKLDKKAKKASKHKSSSEASTSEEVPGPSKQQKTSETSKSKLTNGTAHSDSKLSNGKVAQGSSKLTNGKLHAASQLSNGKTDNGKTSIQKDPTASSTYKSLFTSSDKAKNQSKAHWVTYNPFFN